MGERLVVISDDQQITNQDLNNIGAYARTSLDHVVKDGIEPGKKFTGFSVVQSGPAQVTVGSGRLYVDGAVYFRDDEGGVVLDLINALPAATNKIVTIVVWGQAVDTALEPRTFLVDVDTEQTEARSVATENRRYANVNTVSGIEAADPTPPAIDANVLAVAYIRLTPGGIESVTMVTENRVVSTRAVADRTASLELWRNRTGSRLDVLDTTVTGIQSALRGIAPKTLVLEMARDIGRLKTSAELPETYTSYDADRFLTDDKSDTVHADFLAKVEEGIRFPPAAQRVAQLALANPIDPAVDVRSNFVLPAFTEAQRVRIDGNDSELSLSQFQFQTSQLKKLSRSRTRIRYGSSMTVCTNGAWWNTGTYDPSTRIFTRNGETFYVDLTIDNYWTAPNHIFARVTQFWTDTYEEEYWGYVDVTEGVNGSLIAQTFLNSEAGYISGLDLAFTRVAHTGDVMVGIVRTENGKPLLDKVLAMVTIPATDLKVYPLKTRVPLVPTYLEKGERYAFFIVTAGNHFIATVNGNKNAQGTLFYSTDGAFVQGDLTRDIPFALYYAEFKTPRLEVALQPLVLENGISDIDLNIDTTAPNGTLITPEIQVNGVWSPLAQYQQSLLVGLPPLVNFRVVLTGTTDVMPGFGIGALSEVKTERPRSDLRHISTARTLPAPCDTIEVTTRLEYWDDDRHTCVIKLRTGAGFTTIVTPDAVVDEITPVPGTILRRATFNLGVAVSSYKMQIEGTTDNVLVVYHVAERYDLAFS
ncbi:hypothetical protein LH464_04415 [Neorhizobium sp. T786]|uniref:hypothetical protein n=1 Tax=Pseudorhizobium xiangyangii TaxID=2883104 RepID=UPI001CFF9AA7|nr:hypothetical protein [Neorhizobium xiangyangii]MCB5201722.1 hypothetical protein [Neorhizobium xiangyangii]